MIILGLKKAIRELWKPIYDFLGHMDRPKVCYIMKTIFFQKYMNLSDKRNLNIMNNFDKKKPNFTTWNDI
jgi:hypothetical protein